MSKPTTPEPPQRVEKSDEEWRDQLTPEQFDVCRLSGTEAPFSGRYWNLKAPGTYRCACCSLDLFPSSTKYDSGTGWPSFWDAIGSNRVTLRSDVSHGMRRTEVLCAGCDAHLGHLFSDGPAPTGKRFCMNSASLAFEPAKD